jgi:glutamate synthase (NADPH/NADH) small chain
MDERQDYASIRLNISDELRAIIEQRQILDSDIQQVIDFAEKSGVKLLNQNTGHFLAHHNPGAVTFWVEYTVGDGEFVIYDAYSHRMEVI